MYRLAVYEVKVLTVEQPWRAYLNVDEMYNNKSGKNYGCRESACAFKSELKLLKNKFMLKVYYL